MDEYRERHRTQALPGDDGGFGGFAGMAGPGNPLPPASGQQPRQLVRLPNGVVLDPVAFAGQLGVPVAAVLAAVLGVWRAGSPQQAQGLVDQVERAYGLQSNALQLIASSRWVPAAQMQGMGDWSLPSWDDVKGAVGTVADVALAPVTSGASLLFHPGATVANDPGGTISSSWDFGKKAAGVASDVLLAPATGGLSLLLRPSSKLINDPGGALSATWDFGKKAANVATNLTGKTLVSLGKGVAAGGAPPAPAPLPVQEASMFGSLSLTSPPVLLGGAALLAYLLLRKKPAT